MDAARTDGRWACFLAIAALVVAAAAIRAPGLGRWCYAVDEFYFSQSVGFIVDHGVPRFPTGGYYVRGLPVQYLSAIPALLFGQSELTDRSVPLLFGIAGIALFYLLARNYLRAPFAFLCAATLVASSWHIEFARFARFYSAFQFMFLLFLYALYRGYWRHDRKAAAMTWVIAFVSVFVYEGAVFMPFFAVLPILRSDTPFSKRGFRLMAGAGLLLACNYVVTRSPFRHWGVTDRYPPGLSARGGEGSFPITEPILDLASLAVSSTGLLVGLGALAMLGLWIGFGRRRLWSDPFRAMIAISVIVLPLAHQYGTLVLIVALYALTSPRRRDFLVETLRSFAPYLVMTAAFWVGVAVLWAEVWQPGAGLFVRGYKLAISLFSHFSIHRSLVKPFLNGVPVWGAILFLGFATSLIRNLRTTRSDLSRFPLVVAVLCVSLYPMFDTLYTTTRYSFFFYPILLSLLFTETYALSRWIAARVPVRFATLTRATAVIPIVLFLGSEDFFARHVLDVSSAEANFRTGRYESLRNHWYARTDFESPARFVNENYRAGDIIVTDAVVSSEYLEHPFVNYVTSDRHRFRGISRERGTTELWTGSPMEHTLEGLAARVPARDDGVLWLIAVATTNAPGSFRTRAEVESFIEQFRLSASLEPAGIDGKLGVWRIERGDGPL